MSTYKPTVIIAGRENQLDDPDGLDVSHLANVDYVQFDTAYIDGAVEGRLQWNVVDGTLEVGMPGGNVTLQIGQEHLVRCRNSTGNTINNGSVVYISGQSGDKPLIALSQADDKSTAIVFGMATEDILHNSNGYVNVGGQVRSMNTSGLVEGSYVFLSANTPGGMSTFPATAPGFKARVGYCIKAHDSDGIILVNASVVPQLKSLSDCYGTPTANGDHMTWVTANGRFEVTASKSAFFNGTFRESFDFLLSSNGTAIAGSLEQSGGGDLTMQFSDGETTLNCTPAQTLNITPGTDSTPNGYMVYVPQDTKTLTIATSWPMFTQHIKVAYILVPSATYVLDHLGGYVNQNWNDHLSTGGPTANDQGHLAHIGVRIRQAGADWYSGVSPDGASDSYFTINTGNVYWQSTEGIVSQFHPHTFTAKDTTGTDLAIVVNDPDSTYNHIQNFYTGITKDSTGNTISNNRYFNLVFWGVANKTGDGDWLMVNLPSGVYTIEANAINDDSNHDDYNFPREFDIESGTAFLICRVTFKMGTNDWTWVQTEDLRGLSPNKAAGGAGTNDHGSLGGLADDDHTQYALVDGTRAFTGNVTVLGTLNSGDITSNSGNITLNNGNITLNSGNIALTDGTLTIDDAPVGKLLNVNKSIYLRTDGDDSNGGYSSGDAFLTPVRAITELRKWMVEDYVLTVNVGEGTFNVANPFDPSHKYGANIDWNGVASEYTSLTINNIDGAPSALSTGLQYIDFDVNFAAGSGGAIGQYILVKTTSGGTNPNLVKGCHEIVAWSANVATVRCVRRANVTTMPSGTITANTLTLVKTVFDFNDATAGIIRDGPGHCGTWDKMILKGDLVHTGIWMLRGATIVLGANFGTSKWGTNLNCQYNSNIQADGSVHSYSFSYLVSLNGGGFVSLRVGAILSGCRDIALRVFDAGMAHFQAGQVLCGAVTYTVNAFRGGFVNAKSSVIEGSQTSGSTAFYASSGGGIDASDSTNDAATSYATEAAPGGNGAYISY